MMDKSDTPYAGEIYDDKGQLHALHFIRVTATDKETRILNDNRLDQEIKTLLKQLGQLKKSIAIKEKQVDEMEARIAAMEKE